ncbi:MAG: acyl-ACP--UDP-N-acetylglucosamine O-acyltransferase [Alphaproteobacteria bacterium]|nr:acyl-ACP--UDP-N-acetylglucosamine O-acyltransferase [Alphaproteobacteria bacterium]
MARIHPTAVVEAGAEIDAAATIGPYCVVGKGARLAAGVELKSHVVVAGRTAIGEGTVIFPFASIGHQPQDLKYAGEDSILTIGKRNVIREHVTMNPGTKGDHLETRVGDDGLFMAGSHVAHDCVVGNHVVLANHAAIAGHVRVDDHAILGGLSAVHQFVRIGKHAMIGGMSGVDNDVIPFGLAIGNRAGLMGLNVVGLKRRGFSREEIHDLRAAYRLLFAEEGTLQERVDDVAEMFKASAVVGDIVAFIRADTSRSICQPRAERAP